MKRLITLAVSALTLTACSMPTAPAAPDAAKAKATLQGAAKAGSQPDGRLAQN
jgi:PBP1b-binding outer membrane lipoprotein LpoB